MLRAVSVPAFALLLIGCERPDVLTFSGSAVGAEGELIRRQIARFAAGRGGLDVRVHPTPDAADQRHQLYVQWLNGWAADPDVLQLDVIWTPEFAAAGWIAPLDALMSEGERDQLNDFFTPALHADRWNGRLFALPWFVDVGMLYWRTDLMNEPPDTFDALTAVARRAVDEDRVRVGFVWQGARYEGLVTVFLEYLTGFGGRILDDDGQVVVDSEAGVRALTMMRDSIHADGVVPAAALGWQEEQTRFAFQNGDAAFMRNWPYAAALLRRSGQSAVADRFAVAPMPHAGGRSAAALGGARLAVNARSRQQALAWELVQYLTAPEQMIERAEQAGQFPARRSAYRDERVRRALPIPVEQALAIIERAVPRPVTPIYTQLSGVLQIQLHRALSRQQDPAAALSAAARAMRELLASTGLERAAS